MQITRENFIGQISFDRFQRNVESARENGWTHWIGDIPVHPQLIKFFKAFKDKRYNIVPCVDTNTKAFWNTPSNSDNPQAVSVYYSLGITYPDTPNFRVGSISIEAGKDSAQFCVMSERIENEKFSSGSLGYNIRQSKDMAKALKIALQFLKPLDYDDIQDRCTGALNSGLYNLRDPARSKIREGMSMNNDDVMQEVAHMIASGYTPRTDQFKKALDLMMTEGAELKRMQDYKPRACFVWVKPNSLVYRFTGDREATECTKLDDVPELIRNKLAVLQIASNEDAIADVGVRVSDVNYWVFA